MKTTSIQPLFGMVLFGAVLGTACSPEQPEVAGPVFRQDWVFLYYMPYDNDLGPYAETVLERIQAGTAERVEAAVMVDLPGPGGMSLVTFADRMGRPYRDPAVEDSADMDTFRTFLEQAAALYEARRYAVVILDHGGSLDRLAQDAHPTEQWLSVTDAAAAIADFRQEEPGEVELVFLQVCTKAALAPLYAFRDAGRYTMASQLPVGAPNDYYTPVLQGVTPDMTGASLVQAIAQAEDSQMFLSYTCIDNAAFADRPPLSFDHTALSEEVLAPTLYRYDVDRYADAAAVLTAAGADDAAAWLTERLICGHYISDQPPTSLQDRMPDPHGLSGVSVYVPPSAGAPLRYRPLLGAVR